MAAGNHSDSDKARKDSDDPMEHEAISDVSSQEMVNPMGELNTSLPGFEMIDANQI